MDKKSQQLGLNHSTAQGRLYKMIMFRLVQKAGEDSCFRCGEKILKIEDLSIEHKRPWLDVDPTLFWDLNNLAFSHKTCNYAAGRKGKIPGNSIYDKAPKGTSWCTGHKDYLPIENFGRDNRSYNGKHKYCDGCRKDEYREEQQKQT
jgi:hypothetical protein